MMYLSEIFGATSGMLAYYFQIISNFLCVCLSVSWLTFLLKFGQCRDNSSSGWAIFLKFFGGIPRMLVHLFRIILNFLYVCQSVSCCILLYFMNFQDLFLALDKLGTFLLLFGYFCFSEGQLLRPLVLFTSLILIETLLQK